LKYRHGTFGERSAVEGSFRGLRREQRGSGIDFLLEVPLTLCRAGLRVLWLSITTGCANLDAT